MQSRGFTLIELLIYVSIFAVVGVVLTSIFVVFLRVDIRGTASAEISSQANFILQHIQNLISNASFLVVNDNADDEVDAALAQPHSKLIIKNRTEHDNPATPNDAASPIVVYKDGDFIKIQQGRGEPDFITVSTLNTNRVKVTDLSFTKVSNHPGRDSVIINLTLAYNQPSLPQQISRSFTLGVGKATAAVFDTSLQSGAGSPGTLDIGTAGNRWRHLFVSGNLDLEGSLVHGASAEERVNYFQQGTISVDPPDGIAANSGVTINVAIAGAIAGDKIFLTPPETLEDGLVFGGATTVTGAVNIRIRNTRDVVSGINSARNWYYWLVR